MPQVDMEYLLVDDDGRILAVLQSAVEVALELRRTQARGRVRVVRHDEHGDDVLGASSYVTATPLPSFPERP